MIRRLEGSGAVLGPLPLVNVTGSLRDSRVSPPPRALWRLSQ